LPPWDCFKEMTGFYTPSRVAQQLAARLWSEAIGRSVTLAQRRFSQSSSTGNIFYPLTVS
jgi:hypothetical protein